MFSNQVIFFITFQNRIDTFLPSNLTIWMDCVKQNLKKTNKQSPPFQCVFKVSSSNWDKYGALFSMATDAWLPPLRHTSHARRAFREGGVSIPVPALLSPSGCWETRSGGPSEPKTSGPARTVTLSPHWYVYVPSERWKRELLPTPTWS